MVEIADDHYELDISRARELLGWEPKHFILDTIPDMIANLKADPLGWYEANGITPPPWLETAGERSERPDKLRADAEAAYRDAHERFRWAAFLNMGLGAWLITSPPMLGYESPLDVLERRHFRRPCDCARLRLAVLALRADPLAACGRRCLGHDGAARLLGTDGGRLSERHAGRCADLRLCGADAASGGREHSRRDHRADHPARLGLFAVELVPALADHHPGRPGAVRVALHGRLSARPHRRRLGAFFSQAPRAIRRTAPRKSSRPASPRPGPCRMPAWAR
ncbi:hypothetical protein QW131_00890 [Roseibium salinum]|nr:hypothetical protein [Roseibium salinum]